MPTYTMTGPDGKDYSIDGPAGATQAQVISAIQSQLSSSKSDKPLLEGAEQKKRILEDLAQQGRENTQYGVAGNLAGIGEAGLNMATGLGSSIVGGFRGLAELARGNGLDAAARASQQTQEDYTYKPRLGAGKLLSEVASLPLNAAHAMGNEVLGDTGAGVGAVADYATGNKNGEYKNQGRNVGEFIANTAPDVAATLAGARTFSGKAPIRSPNPIVDTGVNYDIPAYMRKGANPIETTKLREPQAPIDQPLPTLNDHVDIPQSSDLSTSPLDRYIAQDNAEPRYMMGTSQTVKDINNVANVRTIDGSPLDRYLAGERAPIESAVAENVPTIPDVNSELGSRLQSVPTIPEMNAERGQGFERTHVTENNIEPVTLDKQQANAQILQRVGMETARKSALEGDAMKSAVEFQTGHFEEPAGYAAKEQFSHEKTTLEKHIENTIPGAKGIDALDEQSLQNKGQVIAAPYDAMRQYFEAAKSNLYKIADEQAKGKPIDSTKSMDSLLKDREFGNDVMASNQTHLATAIENQFDLYKERNNGKLTVENAEQFRKWLNQKWTYENSDVIGRVKNALDDDVFKSAGEDVYQQARQMHILEKETLEKSNSFTKLMDSDPESPTNRATPYNKIADALFNLSPDQFAHLVNTYKSFPPELQPMVAKALAEMKAHFGDRLIQNGTMTKSHSPKDRPLWNNSGVNQMMNNNSSKIPVLFQPEEIAGLNDLRDAGNIISVNANYPGAAAQTANAAKRGLMSRSLGKASTVTGGAAGSLLGPIGAGIGAIAGDLAGSRIGNYFGESKALKNFNQGIVNLNDNRTISTSLKSAGVPYAKQVESILNAPTVDEAINQAEQMSR